MSKAKITRSLKKEGKAYRFNSDAFKTAIDMKKPVLEDIRGNKKHVSDAVILKEIEQKFGISYDALKKWKTGDNGPADITLVEDLADYFDIDCLDLLIPIEEDINNKMTVKEKELISYVYAQLVDLEDIIQNRHVLTTWTEEEKNTYINNYINRIKSKSEEIIKEIDKSAIDVSKTIRSKLHRLVYEIRSNDDSRTYDISDQRVIDIIANQYWDETDRDEHIDNHPDDAYWLINMENEWLDNMGIDDYKPIDDEHYELVDKYFLAEKNGASGKELYTIMDQIKSYGSGMMFTEMPMTPREVIRHDFCEGLLMVFKHDFPELDDME